MGANVEHQLICKVVEKGDFHTVEKLKIDESFFLGDPHVVSQTKEAFRFIRDHFHHEATYGSVPSWQILQSRFYGFPWVGSNDTLATLCQELRRMKLRAQVLSIADELNSTADVDPFVAMNTIREAASTLASQHDTSSDVLMSNAAESLLQEYQMVQSGQGLIGIPYPWEVLNADTQGAQKGQFIVIYGRPKSMKSWVAFLIACHAYQKGARVLIYSLEMPPIMVTRRCAAILANVEYDKFKKAQLDPATMQRVFDILYYLQHEERAKVNSTGHHAAILATQPTGESSGISSLQSKIREFNPDLVIVDGMYLMRDDRSRTRSVDWKNITSISQDLKGTSRIFNIPVIGVTQANRGAAKDPKQADLAELAYADAIAQDCDLCMRVHKQKDTTTQENEIVLSFPGMREGTLEAFVIHGTPATNFFFKRATVVDPNNPQTPPTNGGGNQGGGGGGGNGGGGGKRSQQRAVPVLPSNWRNPP